MHTSRESVPIKSGFLKTRDNDFDTTKSFLVASMIIGHSFQRMGNFIYDRNLTYYVPYGFVFLAGLTLGGVFYEKLLSDRSQYSWQVLSRGLKLFVIFLVGNAIVIMISPHLLSQFLSLEPYEMFLALINSERGNYNHSFYFSFVILVPISLTFMSSLAFLIWKNSTLDRLFLFVGMIALWIIETIDILDYYAVKLMIVGCIGVLLSKVLTSVNWMAIRTALSKWILPILICYIVYQSVLIFINQEARVFAQHYIIITSLLLLVVYLSSYRLNLTSFGIVSLFNRGLAQYMLFAYLFHIFFLVTLGKFVSRGNLYFAIVMGLLTIAVTTSVGLTVNVLTKRYNSLNKLYSLIFK